MPIVPTGAFPQLTHVLDLLDESLRDLRPCVAGPLLPEDSQGRANVRVKIETAVAQARAATETLLDVYEKLGGNPAKLNP